MKSIEICNPIHRKQKIKKRQFLEDRVWKGILSCMMLTGAVHTLMHSWGEVFSEWRLVTGMTVIAFGSAVCAEELKKKSSFAWGILAVPWLILFLITRFERALEPFGRRRKHDASVGNGFAGSAGVFSLSDCFMWRNHLVSGSWTSSAAYGLVLHVLDVDTGI